MIDRRDTTVTGAAGWGKDAVEARLDTERLRQQLAWRALSAEQMTALIHDGAQGHSSAEAPGVTGSTL
jgi:hypothetical protein